LKINKNKPQQSIYK